MIINPQVYGFCFLACGGKFELFVRDGFIGWEGTFGTEEHGCCVPLLKPGDLMTFLHNMDLVDKILLHAHETMVHLLSWNTLMVDYAEGLAKAIAFRRSSPLR